MEEKLQAVLDEARATYTGPQAVDRLEQLRAHIETCKMVVEHLADEATRMEGYK